MHLAYHRVQVDALTGLLTGLGPAGEGDAKSAAGPSCGSRNQEHPERHLAAGLLQPVAALHGTAAAVNERASRENGQGSMRCLYLQLQHCRFRAATGQHSKVPVPDVVHLKHVDDEGVLVAPAV